jgi:hypothetical protein
MSSSTSDSNQILQKLFDSAPAVRYVALYLSGTLESRERPGLSNASGSESDKYEELIVNPTLLKLVQQRGNIDCGGAKYVLIRYGNFFEFVQPLEGGHISVGIEPGGNLMETVRTIQSCIKSIGF